MLFVNMQIAQVVPIVIERETLKSTEIQWYHPYFFMSFTSLASFVDTCYHFLSLSLSGFKLMFASKLAWMCGEKIEGNSMETGIWVRLLLVTSCDLSLYDVGYLKDTRHGPDFTDCRVLSAAAQLQVCKYGSAREMDIAVVRADAS